MNSGSSITYLYISKVRTPPLRKKVWVRIFNRGGVPRVVLRNIGFLEGVFSFLLRDVTQGGVKNGHFGRYVIIEWTRTCNVSYLFRGNNDLHNRSATEKKILKYAMGRRFVGTQLLQLEIRAYWGSRLEILTNVYSVLYDTNLNHMSRKD